MAPLPLAAPLTPALAQAAATAATAVAAIWAARHALHDPDQVSLRTLASDAAAKLAAGGAFMKSSLGPYRELLDQVLNDADGAPWSVPAKDMRRQLIAKARKLIEEAIVTEVESRPKPPARTPPAPFDSLLPSPPTPFSPPPKPLTPNPSPQPPHPKPQTPTPSPQPPRLCSPPDPSTPTPKTVLEGATWADKEAALMDEIKVVPLFAIRRTPFCHTSHPILPISHRFNSLTQGKGG